MSGQCLFNTYRTTGADLSAGKAQRRDSPEAERDGQLLELTAYTLPLSELPRTFLLSSASDLSPKVKT